MSTDPETTRIVRSWLDAGVTQLPDRVLDAVLDQVPATPQRRVTWWPARRNEPMNAIIKFGLAAAVVAVVALIGLNFLGTSSVGGPGIGDSTPTPTLEPTPTATPEGLLESGATVRFIEGPGFIVTMTIPGSDWYGSPDPILTKTQTVVPPDGIGIVAWTGDLFVYGDPCQWSDSLPDAPVGPTVDDLVVALSAQPMRDASPATDITVDGYAGKAIELTVPDDLDLADCDSGEFRSWVDDPAMDGARYHQGPGQHDLLWIIDVDGTRLVVDAAYFDGTPAADRAELQALLDSIQIEPAE